jgi:hypothetical protein
VVVPALIPSRISVELSSVGICPLDKRTEIIDEKTIIVHQASCTRAKLYGFGTAGLVSRSMPKARSQYHIIAVSTIKTIQKDRLGFIEAKVIEVFSNQAGRDQSYRQDQRSIQY